MEFGYARAGAVQLLEQQRWIGDSVRRSYDCWLTAKYALNWKLFSNPASGRAFRRVPPRLDAVQGAVVDRLRRDGLALIPFGEMVRDPELLRQLDEAAGEFAQGPIVEDALQGYRAALKEAAQSAAAGKEIPEETKTRLKEYYISLYPTDRRPRLRPDDLWLRTGLLEPVLDVVNTYFGMWSKLTYFNLWHTVPVGSSYTARFGSQLWHRDPEDQRKLRLYLYFRDTDESSGPLEYILGSHGYGPDARIWGWQGPLKNPYPPQDEVEKVFPPTRKTVCTGEKWTLVLCDTYGLHRGGISRDQPRLLATWQFVTPASLHQKRYELESLPSDLTPAARFAVS